MKILVPVDGSAYSLKALEAACDLAKSQAPSSLILVAVAMEIPELGEGRYIYDKMKAQAEAALARATYSYPPICLGTLSRTCAPSWWGGSALLPAET